ncbi:phosphatidylinositol 3,4,5-trisphosphate 3-phosphatase and dual-specificity protein phosphatase PTEN isoform X1 [Drosophila serrata]|uniref:phosphatidylinositol 3,4,5-trisphosphate 3-phosphatase and dual-specificity protein phosphatase PTEN isoform X1 n=1 Tax=Drosophila serrata TaxID=7274 RepID=UPI000A1CF802|nr:phosphatidylinositol 3,4,5-trisphosphate 3-phosphatase and dual-specificity protein phosphatase PTEN isoform X1 [Drosophila serrata]XP_020807189.1 phosphatidylinositol 3,4,5-trisphosphate 3-phosphatase and dual-specificity protein phosphatase PTEN isoform X1 [Drosophila serrata]XP_020807190.1 phosphatidylinositol 3,4,5-trisphosphate 3-phosphatase and dual-specificity protein phosphatase PTEN isoform X1 [Drosophila serrata]
MANTISLMSNAIRNVVSKKRIRYKEKGYNLDLTYIDERIIAMGYPAPDILEGIYRNRFEDVYKFLEENHGQHYKIYNLCPERNYDISKFHGRVGIFPFEDHNPPTIELIQRFCKDVDLWLKENDANVVAIHCKAGKGRTGTMICAYLLYSGLKKSADEALAWYDEKRTKDGKGVTIPSQRRYVQYFSKLVCSSVPYSKISLNVCEIRFSVSSFLQNLGTVECSVSVLTDSATENVKPERLKTWTIDFQKSFVLTSSPSFAVAGDLKFELAQKSSRKIVCHFWLNTFFVQNSSNCEAEGSVNKYTLTLSKSEIDDVHKDRKHKFSEDFKFTIIFEADNYCNNVQAEQPSELEKNDNVLHNCFLKKKALSAIVNENNTSKSQTIEPLLDHKDHNIVTKIQYDTSANSKNTCSSSSASKRKQPNNSKPLSSSLNDSSTREDIKKNHMYNNQPSIKKTDLITWQNSDVHITSSSDTRSINENKNINYNSYITCNQSSNPKFSCGTEEGEEDWESGESTYL